MSDTNTTEELPENIKQMFIQFLRETLVPHGDLSEGDVVLSIEYGEGVLTEKDYDGDWKAKTSSGRTFYVDEDEHVFRLQKAGERHVVYLPTNSDKNLLGGTETLADVTGYIEVYVDDPEKRPRIFETNSERNHLILEHTYESDMPESQKLKKKYRKMLALVSEHYRSGEEIKIFFQEFMEGVV